MNSSIANPKLRDDLSLLIEANYWKEISTWFSYWSNEGPNEMIPVIRKDVNGKEFVWWKDSGIPRDLVDKVILWGHFFMPEYLRDKTPIFHRWLIACFFSEKNEFVAAPRGFSKTTLFQLCISFAIVNRMDEFIVIIEKTFTEASEVLDAVRTTFVDNPMVVKIYGDLLKTVTNLSLARKPRTHDAQGDVFINGIRLRAKGFDSSVRGLKSKEYRPTRIICDDLEKDEHINNPEQRKKYLHRYNKQIVPAVDVDGTIKVFGTILHMDSLLMNLIQMHKGVLLRGFYLPHELEYEHLDLPEEEVVYNDKATKAKLLWYERWPWHVLMRKKKDMQDKNNSSHAFEQEIRNNPIAEEDRKFKYGWLHNEERKMKLSELKKKGLTLNGYACIDTADATTENADFIGVIVTFVDENANWYRVDCRREKRNVNGLIDLIFQVWETWYRMGLSLIGVEKKAFEDQVRPLLDQAMRQRQKYPNVIELKPMGRSKENRILGALQGRYEHGKIWTVTDDRGVPVGDTDILLDELHNFPASAHDDLSDAEAYISDVAEVPFKDEKEAPPQRQPQDDPYAEPVISSGADDDPYS